MATQPIPRPVKPQDATWTQVYPDIAETQATVEEHFSQDHFQKEIDGVFRRTWLFAAMEMDVPNVGDYIVREFPGYKASIIIVRGSDGQIRALHNACRHRCAKLLDALAHGRARAFTCEFHGWRYSIDGTLIGIPDIDGILDKKQLGLVPIRVETWNGFIFVNLDRSERESFSDFIATIADHPLNRFPFNDVEWESWRWRIQVDANWKVVKDLFLETYHVAFVHAESVDKIYASPDNPFHRAPAIDFFGLHHRLTASRSPTYKSERVGPVGLASVKHGGASVSRLGTAKKDAPGINPDGLDNWGADLYSLFPNFNIHIFGERLWHYHIFEPIAPGKMMWENRIFFPKAENAGERFAHAFSRSVQGIVSLEDMCAAERNQQGMEMSGAPTLALHDQEIQLRFLRRALREYMAG